tara:strand:+ start:170 stop:1090 length:921 start_codon:yes stop_codon:yes gene_type:complete
MKKEVIKSIDENQSAIEKCLLDGDLSGLSDDQRASYYNQVCETVGLNPLTQPFQYIILNGKLKMYALKGATDQLRRIYNISCEVKNTEKIEDLLVITVKATNNSNGRVDEDMGFAKISGLKGDMLGNAMLKATTKAKRRVTLSMCGLGMLDEEEIASIPDDKGNGKGKKEFNPTKGSEKLKEILTTPSEPEPEPEPVEESDDTHISLMSDDSLEDEKFEQENESGYMKAGIIEKIRSIVKFDIEKVSQDEQEDHLLNHQDKYQEMCRYINEHNLNWQKDLIPDDYEYIQNYCREIRSVYKPEMETA